MAQHHSFAYGYLSMKKTLVTFAMPTLGLSDWATQVGVFHTARGSCHVCIGKTAVRYTQWGKFPSLYENVVLGSPKSFFQLDHQVDISLYLT